MTPGTGDCAASDKLQLDFGYLTSASPSTADNYGNILSQTITAPASSASLTLTQNYTYDQANRLASAAETGSWSRSYGYDQFGNRWVASANHALPMNTPTELTDFNPANNHLATGNYDAAGNLLSEPDTGTMTYDANNKMASFVGPVVGTEEEGDYFYDGEGNRVQRVTRVSGTATTTVYVYDAFGKLAAEYTTAAPSNPGTHYRTTDHLGSTRIVTLGDQSVMARRDFFPFGEEIGNGFGSRTTVQDGQASSTYRAFNMSAEGFDQQFTGQLRDTESNLDYFLARYYSSPMGRFLSVDPGNAGAVAADPQSWNGYSYVGNNPTAFVDPDGRARLMVQSSGPTREEIIDAVVAQVPERLQGTARLALDILIPEPTDFGPLAIGGAGKRAGGAALKRLRRQLKTNKKAGDEFEAKVTEKLSETQDDVVEQITLKTKLSGTRTRVDNLGKDRATRTTKVSEAKASTTAPLTKNQKKAIPEIEKGGAVVVGRGKPPFTGGTDIPPTKVNILRPEDLK